MAKARRIVSWQPVGIEDLEPAAETVVRSAKSYLVVAGPGAGKTELLAQRACFLLQTGQCDYPRRILAISFKKDAARNLHERVALRCGREIARRFESYTFDSFAKSLVDRFMPAVPKPFRPSSDYKMRLDLDEKKAKEIVAAWKGAESALSAGDRYYLNKNRLWEAFINRDLPLDGRWDNRTHADVAAADLWEYLLRGELVSAVNFPMVGRIAGLLFETNPAIVTALRCAYEYVFLDEFQDTTRVQYALVRKGFTGSQAIITAVGDPKQRIMGWAGAMERAFDAIVADFGAERVDLVRNYRSSARLVEVQGFVARALDKRSVGVKAMGKALPAAGECRVLAFSSEKAEAEHLAEAIAGWISNDGVVPRDICVLCRNREESYTKALVGALASRGVRARVERALQDLLAEPLTECVLDALKLACKEREAEAWARMFALLEVLEPEHGDADAVRRARRLATFSEDLARCMPEDGTTDASLRMIGEIMEFVGQDAFRAGHPEYQQGDYYEQSTARLANHLAEAFARTNDWGKTVEDFEGTDSVPIMTTHKSKGLEYHTIVFVGLEDGAYWGFAKNPTEEICTFFVALSRAKERALFTFCNERNGPQSRDAIGPIYNLLGSAGIEVEDMD